MRWRRACAAPPWWSQAPRTRITDPSGAVELARLLRGGARAGAGDRPCALDPPARPRQPPPSLVRGDDHARYVIDIRAASDHLDPGARTAGGARCTSRPRSGSGTPSATSSIADELRKLHPDLEIDWLAQHPVTTVLETRGERIHPLSAELASESAHVTNESSEHDLNAFQAIRRMDEILVANFMVFHDAVEEGEYDLVIGDEAWDVDHFLHENPELKRTAFAWMTDFVGWLPMPEGGDREAFLTADYNAEMIEHVERFPRIRDRAIFVGDPDDIVPDDFGPDMPNIREWTERHYAFSGYVTGFDPTPLIEDREALRRDLGYRPDERVVIVTVGGSGVGEALLRKVIAAYPAAARRVNGLRMIAVAGPRIDPERLGAPAGVEVRGLRPRAVQAPGRVRPRGRPGRADDDDGARRGPAAVPVLPAAQPLRAEPPRPAPPRPLRRRPVHGLRRSPTPTRSPRPSPRRSTGRSPRDRSSATARRGPRR